MDMDEDMARIRAAMGQSVMSAMDLFDETAMDYVVPVALAMRNYVEFMRAREVTDESVALLLTGMALSAALKY